MNEAPTVPSSRPKSWFLWIGLAAVLLSILLAALRLLNTAAPALPVLGQVPDFTLTNQLGRPISLADLRGQVWVANLIFTRCPGPCPVMTRRLAEVQSALPAAAPVKLVSLTSDPEFDTPAVLQRFAAKFGADPSRWNFLTGPKPAIRNLAVDGLKLAMVETDPKERVIPEDLFVHSTLFIVVDKQGRMRQVVQGLEDPAVTETLAAIHALLREK